MFKLKTVFLLFCTLLLQVATVHSNSFPQIQTQNKLKQLDTKIHSLQHSLASAKDKQGLLNKELSHTEKQIGEGTHQLRSIKIEMGIKEQKIAALQNTANTLNQQLIKQQQLLANHIRARYQMGAYQPLKWMLNQDDPYKISRLLSYYQYIIKSRQQLIATIDETEKKLNDNKEKLHHELRAKQQLHYELTQHQQQLEHNKSYHTSLIQSINHEINNDQHALKDFQRDKDNLSRLLHSLTQQSITQNNRSFPSMRRKLPHPIHMSKHNYSKMNQGVTFFADEGTTVTAVSSGKVVFSDWLKGYGLLLIIDHGQGFMTLYAHNQSLFKRKGEYVQTNEQIATVGHSGGIKQNGLYFEIRVRGKAVSPFDWLLA